MFARKPIRFLYAGIGIVLISGGAYVLWAIPEFYLHSNEVGSELLNQANDVITASAVDFSKAGTTPVPMEGLLGEIRIDKLSLAAPLLQGTDEKQINVAAGHLTTSVLPGEQGTSVIAAHNATWFRHIDELKPGDVIHVDTTTGDYEFSVKTSKIVKTGDPLYNSPNSTLVLETCYPLNALYLTPYRYLVFADLIGADNQTAEGGAAPQLFDVLYHTNVPDKLRTEGLTLKTNSLPMGSLTYEGTPSDRYVQSNAPLNAAHAMVELYLAWLHANANGDVESMSTLLPASQPTNSPWLRVPLSRYQYHSGFNIRLQVAGDTLQSITATTIVKTGSVYSVTVHAVVHGNDVELTSLETVKQ